jgi:hypothetical protein
VYILSSVTERGREMYMYVFSNGAQLVTILNASLQHDAYMRRWMIRKERDIEMEEEKEENERRRERAREGRERQKGKEGRRQR